MAQLDIFSTDFQNRIWRRQFFFNAFSALRFNGIDGDYAEFGCWGGVTFNMAFMEARRSGHPAKLWAYDSFQGLPAPESDKDDHPIWKEGALDMTLEEFHQVCAANQIPREAYEAVPGFYSDTLHDLAADAAPVNIALAYIDCDLYSSTMSVLNFLLPRLKHGMILGFDDYFCWSATQIAGERRAMLELLENHERWHLLPFMQFGWHGNSFVVEDRALLA